MKNLFFTLLIMLSCSIDISAQNTLNIYQKDGTLASYSFKEKPVVTYTETALHLSTSNLEIDYPINELEKFTFSDEEATVVGELETESSSNDIYIYNTNGTLVQHIKQNGGHSKFSTEELPIGLYIIKNGQTTFKILKK